MKNKNFIPFFKIELPKKVLDECRKILASGNLTNSTYVERFEKEVAKVAKTKYAVATNSCTNGLMLVCREVFCFEDKIGVPDYTWESTKSAVYDNYLTPVWLDVDEKTWCIENHNIKWWHKLRCDGYLVVDTFGNKCDIDTKKPVICDAAHSFGIPHNKKFIASVYSFAPAKTFTAGEGGCIVTDEKWLYDELKETVRWAGRMQEVNACIGLYYISQHKEIIKEKKKIFEYYKKHLPWLQFQKVTNSNYNIVNVYTTTQGSRNIIYNGIKNKLGTKIRYQLTSGKNLHNSKELYETSFFIPIWKGIDYKKVVKILNGGVF